MSSQRINDSEGERAWSTAGLRQPPPSFEAHCTVLDLLTLGGLLATLSEDERGLRQRRRSYLDAEIDGEIAIDIAFHKSAVEAELAGTPRFNEVVVVVVADPEKGLIAGDERVRIDLCEIDLVARVGRDRYRCRRWHPFR